MPEVTGRQVVAGVAALAVVGGLAWGAPVALDQLLLATHGPREQPAGTRATPDPTTSSTVTPSAATPTAGPSASGPGLPSGTLDPTALESRRIERARLLLSYPQPDGTVLAVDAATDEWVRAEVPGLAPEAPVTLSPDGTRLAFMEREPLEAARLIVVALADGARTDVPLPSRDPDECRNDGVAWAPDSRHLAVFTGCFAFDRDDPGAEPETESWVEEVALGGGEPRLLDHVRGGAVSDGQIAYSPDGLSLAYPIAYGYEEVATRVVDVDGAPAVEHPDWTPAWGDPWRDDATLLVSSEESPEALLDTTTGRVEPLGVADLMSTYGFLGESLVVGRTTWLDRPRPCDADFCLADLDSGRVEPWIVLDGSLLVGLPSAARDLTG